MKLSQDQFDRLSEGALEAFVRRVRDHVRESFPEQCQALDDAEVEMICRGGVHRAGEYGIRTQREVCKFVDLMFVLGSDFDHRSAWIGTLLRDTSIPAEDRVTRLVQAAMAAMR